MSSDPEVDSLEGQRGRLSDSISHPRLQTNFTFRAFALSASMCFWSRPAALA
jgi:hypothetical protein